MHRRARAFVLVLCLLGAGCGRSGVFVDRLPEAEGQPDGGEPDASSRPDARVGLDASLPDASRPDASLDAGRDAGRDASLPGPDASFPAGFCSGEGWCWEMPLPHGDAIAGAWGSSRGDAFAATWGGRLLHWDGRAWSVAVETEWSGFTDLKARGPADIWAASWEGIHRWNGQSWSLAPTPQELVKIGGAFRTLWPVGPNEAWAIDNYGRSVWRWDGASWSESLKPSGGLMRSFAGTGPADVWVGGSSGLHHWDGVRWSDEPFQSGTYGDVRSLWAGDGEVWAVSGELMSTGSCKVFRKRGGTWAYQRDVPRSVGSRCSPVWGSSATDVAVLTPTTLERWDGAKWTSSPSPLGVSAYGMSGDWGGARWAFGAAGSVAHFDGKGWAPVGTPADRRPDRALRAVACGAEVLAGGDGMVLSRGPSGWTVGWEGPETIHSVAARAVPTPLVQGWAVGTKGLILRREAGAWREERRVTSADLRGVAVAGNIVAWAVGNGGTVLDFRGHAGWGVLPAPTARDLVAIWAESEEAFWALADDGSVYRQRRGSWTTVAGPSGGGGRSGAIWGRGPDDVWFVDYDAKDYAGSRIRHWDGTRLGAVTQPSYFSYRFRLNAVAGSLHPDEIYFGGFDSDLYGAAIFRLHGTAWTRLDVAAHTEIQGLCGDSSGGFFAAGGGVYQPSSGKPAAVLHWDGR